MYALKFFTAIILGAAIFFVTLTGNTAFAEKKILINSASRLMLFYDNGVKRAVYHLGLGKVDTPTPTGYYKIETKEINPPWISPDDPEYEVPSGPDNPLGYRWMQISGNYGIHGTNRPESIGGYVSNGCIRMNERDVEELFDAVEVGTPVEITYNRIVVEKTAEDDVVYYIYPDGYGWQDIKVDDVKKWLEPFGVLAFESDYDISQKIEASDGEPTFIGKPYNVEVNGELTQPTDANNTRYFAKAVLREGISYLPVVPIAKILRVKLEWYPKQSSIKTKFGRAFCYDKKGQLYCNADDATVLFNLEGGLQTGEDGVKIFRFKSVPQAAPVKPEPVKPEPVKPEPKVDDKPKPVNEQKVDTPKSVDEQKVDTPKSVDEQKVDTPKSVDDKKSVDETKTDEVNAQ